MTPSIERARSASRRLGLLMPKISMSSRSGGSLSPARRLPVRISSRIRATTCWPITRLSLGPSCRQSDLSLSAFSPFFTQVRQHCSTLQLLSAFSTQQLFSDLLTRNRRRLLSDLHPEPDLRSKPRSTRNENSRATDERHSADLPRTPRGVVAGAESGPTRNSWRRGRPRSARTFATRAGGRLLCLTGLVREL